MANVVNEIRNWHLFTEKFGEEYQMHDAVIKRFDLNEDDLIIVVNTLYEMEDDKVYDITFTSQGARHGVILSHMSQNVL